MRLRLLLKLGMITLFRVLWPDLPEGYGFDLAIRSRICMMIMIYYCLLNSVFVFT